MRLSVDRTRRWFAIVVLAAGCKSAPARSTSDLADDLAQIEAELQRSDARLGEAGIVVAYRETPPPDGAVSPSQESPPVDDEPGESPSEPAPDQTPTTPTVREPEPATPVEAEDSGPKLSSPRAERERDRERREPRRHVKKSARTRCERVCDLSATTCELQDRVCTLAGNHPDDVRYEDACRRAEDQCEAATRSCESCAV